MTERRVAVKICGLRRREDAERAAALGADYGGVVLAPGGKRSIVPEEAAHLLQGLPLRRVGVFVDASAPEVVRAAEVVGLQVVQLHGEEPPALLRALRAEGRWAVWKAVRPRSAEELAAAVERYAEVADALLLDGWSASAPGGTGSRFPWRMVAAGRDVLPSGLPLVAAGGLTPSNVARAIALLRPDVVDVSSGVESAPGVKDAAALSAFLCAVRAADISPEAES